MFYLMSVTAAEDMTVSKSKPKALGIKIYAADDFAQIIFNYGIKKYSLFKPISLEKLKNRTKLSDLPRKMF